MVSCNFCTNVMRQNKCLLILSNFHTADNSAAPKEAQKGYDSLYNLCLFLELCVCLPHAYQSDENITSNEGKCKYRGSLIFKQYISQKLSKDGIKLYVIRSNISKLNVFCGQRNISLILQKLYLGECVEKATLCIQAGTTPDVLLQLSFKRSRHLL